MVSGDKGKVVESGSPSKRDARTPTVVKLLLQLFELLMIPGSEGTWKKLLRVLVERYALENVSSSLSAAEEGEEDGADSESIEVVDIGAGASETSSVSTSSKGKTSKEQK